MSFTARVRLIDPTGIDAEGNLFLVNGAKTLEWDTVPYLEPEECEHGETMCRQCASSWSNDYDIVIPDLT